MAPLEGRIRIAQSCHDLDALEHEIARWIKRRQDRDTLQQYRAQLQTLSTFFGKALSDLRVSLGAIPATMSRGLHYVECRKFDKSLVIVRRVWDFFRSRFDQRDDPCLANLLRSADEIVWSCYRGSMQSAAEWNDQPSQTAPLPFIQSRYSAEAHTRDVPPADLKSDPDLAFAREFLLKLPVPVVGLPPMCVESPWMLAILAHEVGHHFQNDALPKFGLLGVFRDLLKLGVQRTGAENKQAERWGKWQSEIFADLYSVLQLGPAASWAITELEWADEATLLTGGKSAYPIPVVRLALLSQWLIDLEFDESLFSWRFASEPVLAEAARRPDLAQQREVVQSDLQLVPEISRTLVREHLPGFASAVSLPDFIGTNHRLRDEGTMTQWRDALLGKAALLPLESLEAPRVVISAAVAAWLFLSSLADDGQRERQRAILRSNLLDVLPRCREPGTRASVEPVDVSAEELGAEFASLLQRSQQSQIAP